MLKHFDQTPVIDTYTMYDTYSLLKSLPHMSLVITGWYAQRLWPRIEIMYVHKVLVSHTGNILAF